MRLTLLALSALIATAAPAATTFHVSPLGRDDAAGTADAPFATLARARDAVRASPERGRTPLTVQVQPGTYYLDATLEFTAADAGTIAAPVTYVAESAGSVIVSGGQKLALTWQPWRNGIYRAATPAGFAPDQLFVNGRRLPMARYPNFDASVAVYNGYAADAFSRDRAARWADPAGGYIHAMHKARWGGYHYRITGKNADGDVTYEGGWQNNRQMGMHAEHRFVENIFEELDAPGEWFHDAKTATLYLFPPTDTDLSRATVEGVRLRELVAFRGTTEAPVHSITLRGFVFRHTARTFMENREPLLRSDWTIARSGAVFFTGAEDCAIEDATFDQVGGNAVFASGYVRRLAVRRTHIVDPGASGVAFVGSPNAVRDPLFEYGEHTDYTKVDHTPGPKSENYPADCVVEDALIHGVGVVEKQAAGVQIAMARRITVRHCSIYDTSRAGINIGDGTWGGHLIEGCDVFDTVRETHDHGSFNSWGRDRFWDSDPTTLNAAVARTPELPALDAVETTTIRDSRWRCDHGWDIDLDDGSSNYHIYNNLCLRGGIKLREGYRRIVENNIMVNNGLHPHVWLQPATDVFRRNIVMLSYRPARMTPKPWGAEMDYNWLHAPGAGAPSAADELRALSGRDAHSQRGDAGFVNAAVGDFRVRDNSPVFTLGFKNFPMNQFGVRPPALRALARTPQLPKVAAATAEASARDPRVATWQGARVRNVVGLTDVSALGLPSENGVLVLELPAGSVAARTKLRVGDVIVAVNQTPVSTVADLERAFAGNVSENAPRTLHVIRNQQEIALMP